MPFLLKGVLIREPKPPKEGMRALLGILALIDQPYEPYVPSTLNPKPSTLNPKPSTLNSEPLALNPHPETPKSEHCINIKGTLFCFRV